MQKAHLYCYGIEHLWVKFVKFYMLLSLWLRGVVEPVAIQLLFKFFSNSLFFVYNDPGNDTSCHVIFQPGLVLPVSSCEV